MTFSIDLKCIPVSYLIILISLHMADTFKAKIDSLVYIKLIALLFIYLLTVAAMYMSCKNLTLGKTFGEVFKVIWIYIILFCFSFGSTLSILPNPLPPTPIKLGIIAFCKFMSTNMVWVLMAYFYQKMISKIFTDSC